MEIVVRTESGEEKSIRLGNQVEEPATEDAIDKSTSKSLSAFLKNGTAEEVIAAACSYAGKQIMSTTISMVKQSASIEVNRYFALDEDYMLQNSLNNFMQEASTISSVVVGTKDAAMSGAKVAGVPGAIVGALFGLGKGIFQTYIQRAKTIEAYQMELNATNIQTAYGATRASLYNEGRGTEN